MRHALGGGTRVLGRCCIWKWSQNIPIKTSLKVTRPCDNIIDIIRIIFNPNKRNHHLSSVCVSLSIGTIIPLLFGQPEVKDSILSEQNLNPCCI